MSRKKHKLSLQMITIDIEALSHDGRGVARIDGKTLFLDNGLPGETVLFNYLRKHSKYDEGAVVNVIKPSPDRVTPSCAHANYCGGCTLQHMHSDAQIAHKQAVMLEQLQHIGGVKPEILLPPLKSSGLGYRRKARLGVRFVHKKDKLIVGFREKNGRYLADLESCSVLHPSVGQNINAIKTLITTLETYQQIPQIEVAVGDEITVLIIRHLQDLTTEDKEKLRQFAIKHNFHLYLQPDGPDSAKPFWPEQAASLHYQLPEYNLELLFQPTDFTQVNAEINRQMIMQALNLLQPNKNDRILDLFCGLGNFSLPLAKYSKQVIGVEGDLSMVERAKANAIHNNITNTEFYSANLAGNFQTEAWAQQQYDKILLDPPRCGAWEVTQYMPRFRAKQILYISCNPATLARDAAELVKQKYVLKKAGVMDMFPHTSHVEAMALFELSP